MQQITEAQRLARQKKTDLQNAKSSLTKLENGLASLPAKFARMEAEQKAKIEAQRKYVEELENQTTKESSK